MSIPLTLRALPAIIALGACSGGSGGVSAPSAAPVETVLSAPGCANAENIIADKAVAPTNVTVVRAQYVGDEGTAERNNAVANTVTWDVGAVSGLHVPSDFQRGYRDLGPPVNSSAFQLRCDAAGFALNSWTFSHTLPVAGAGPSASVLRRLEPAVAPFRDASTTIILEARVAVPWVLNESTPVGDGTAQVSFVYYAQDLKSGVKIAHVVGLYENRPPGTGGSGLEHVGNDGLNAYAGSPLQAADFSGTPIRFVSVAAGSATARYVQPFDTPALFRAQVSYAQFRDLLDALRRNGSPSISPDPLDYRIYFIGVLGEIFPGTGSGHNVALGGNVSGLTLTQVQPGP